MRIVAFLRNELKRFKRVLGPDYLDNIESKEEDDSDAREGALMMVLHFLRIMNEKHLADKLQKSKSSNVQYIEMKQEFVNHC